MRQRLRRRRLPHWDKPGAIYFVTSCLEGSIPAHGKLDIAAYRQQLTCVNRKTSAHAPHINRQIWKRVFARSDEWMDQRPQIRHFADRRLAEEVENAIFHFAGSRYALWAHVVMPSHFHFVFEPINEWVSSLGVGAEERSPRERIMHSIKRHTGRQCNQLLGRRGKFWQDESYDHCIEDVHELGRVIDYVELNPVRAGLCASREQFRFSSARHRTDRSIPLGRPIVGSTAI